MRGLPGLTPSRDQQSPERGGGRERPIAFFISQVEKPAAFANLTRALAAGVVDVGGGPVDILYLGKRGSSGTAKIPPGVRLVPLDASRSMRSIPSLIGYLRQNRPRALITMPALITLPALIAYRLSGRKVRRGSSFVIYQGDTLKSELYMDYKRTRRLLLMPTLAKILFPYADAMIACAPGVIELLQRDGTPLPGGRAEVIPNPVDIELYAERATAEPPAHPWLADKSGPVITTLSTMGNRKNHPLLLRALAEIRRNGCNSRLIFFGDGPARERTEALASELGLSEFVSFAGFVPNPHADISRSDLFVISSDDEAFCLALVEAMACGVPVVSTDAVGGGPKSILLGSPGEINADDAQVLRSALVPCGDSAALANAIQRCIEEPAFGKALSEAGLRRVEAFAPRPIGARWVEYLHQLELEREARSA